MLRKINLVSAVLALTVILLCVSNSMALAVFTIDGVKLICRTCTCAEMKDAGVPWEHCVDTALTKPGTLRVYDRITRYSVNDVRLRSPDGKEFPLASDATQREFEAMVNQRNFKQLFSRLRPVSGPVSNERVESLAKDLGVDVVENQTQDSAIGEGQGGGAATLLATIRGGRLLSLRSLAASDRAVDAGGDVYKAQATSRGGKLVLQFDRPLSRESRMELKIDSLINLDQDARSSLGVCGCLPGTTTVENANARNATASIAASQKPKKHRRGTKYIVDACWP